MSRLHCKMPVCNKKHLSLTLSLSLCVHKSLALCSKTERGNTEPLDCRGVSDDCCRFQFLRDIEKEKVCTCLCECVSFGGSAELGILVCLGDAECVLLWLSWETWAAVVRSALNLLPALAFAGMLWLSAAAGYYYLLSFTCNQFYRVFSQNDPDTQGWQMQQRREADL